MGDVSRFNSIWNICFYRIAGEGIAKWITAPVVQVKVDYKSASAEIIDQEVTQVLEDVIGGSEGIKNIDSNSENGNSTINIEFNTDIDLDSAANDIRERVARVVIIYLVKLMHHRY